MMLAMDARLGKCVAMVDVEVIEDLGLVGETLDGGLATAGAAAILCRAVWTVMPCC